jgi:CopG family transcriptional regulator / antitoxin EndoAI
MKKHKTISMYKRINITLPSTTIKLLDRSATKRGRSRLIDHAVQAYLDKAARAELRRLLKEGAIVNAERDLAMAREAFPLAAEVWPEY